MKHRLFTVFLISSFILTVVGCAPDAPKKEDQQEDFTEVKKDSETKPLLQDTVSKPDAEEESGHSLPEINESESSKETPAKEHATKVGVKVSPINMKVGRVTQKLNDFDLMGYAAEEVALIHKEKCDGENCGDKIELKNYNSEKSINVVVNVKWKDAVGKQEQYRTYTVKPEALLYLGCGMSCSEEKSKYNWKIVSATYN